MKDRTGWDHSRIFNHAPGPPARTFDLDPARVLAGYSARHQVSPALTAEVGFETVSAITMIPVRDDASLPEQYPDVEQYRGHDYHGKAMCKLTTGAWPVAGDLTLNGVVRRRSSVSVQARAPTRSPAPASRPATMASSPAAAFWIA